MPGPAPFGPIAEILERSVSIRHVFGEPLQRGDVTVVPVAQVAYGFGAGGGRGPVKRRGAPDVAAVGDEGSNPEGAGGGGGVRLTPVGALEIGPSGTRFIELHPWSRIAAAGLLGVAAGLLLRRRR